MDVFFIKKDPEEVLNDNVCQISRGILSREKRLGDEMLKDVFEKLMAYAYLYKSQNTFVYLNLWVIMSEGLVVLI